MQSMFLEIDRADESVIDALGTPIALWLGRH